MIPNDTIGETFPLQTWERSIFLAIDCLLAVAIILGNTLVILSVIRERRLRTPTNTFIASLAVADLMVGLVVIPIDVAFGLGYAGDVTLLSCLASSNVLTVMIIVSVLHLTVIAYDRYLAITNPLSYVTKMSRVRIALLISAAWIAALSVSSMPLMGWNNLDNYKHDYCDLMFVHAASYRFLSVSISVVVPLNLMMFFYYRMFRVAKSHLNRIAAQEATTTRRRSLRRDVKAAKTVAIIFGFFLVGCTPASLICLIDTLKTFSKLQENRILIFELASFHIAFTNSMVNPIIYAFRNKDFRFSFLKLAGVVFRCECWKRRIGSAARDSEMTGCLEHVSASLTIVRPAKVNISTPEASSKPWTVTLESHHSKESSVNIDQNL